MEKKIDKEGIVEALRAYVERMGGQNRAANSMKGVSSATLSQMASGNWEHISGEMWRKVGRYVQGAIGWAPAETGCWRDMQEVLEAVQEEGRAMCLTAPAGSGKTFCAGEYAKGHGEVYVLKCDEYWSQSDFVDELLRSMGMKAENKTKRERLSMACAALLEKERPLLIFDEFDKLKDSVWYFFITLYNRLEERVAMVTLSTDYIARRFEVGLKYRRKGYEELWSRLGGRCVEVRRADYEDVRAVCAANGVTEESLAEEIFRSSRGDMRRVKQLVLLRVKK